MTTPLERLHGLLPSLVPEERRGRPGAAREAALAAAEAHAEERAAYQLVAVYACLAAGEAGEALRLLDGIAAPEEAITRRVAACRVWAQMLERNWYPGDIGGELPEGYLAGVADLADATAADAESLLVEACVVFGPRMVLTTRSIVDSMMLRAPGVADRIAGSALQSLGRFGELAQKAGAVSAALWAQAARTDIARRIGRLAEAREALASIRTAYEAEGDPVGVAATWLLEGDWLATPGASPESLGLRLEDESVPSFATQRDDAAAAQSYSRAAALLAGVDAPRARGALGLRLALMASRAGDLDGQRKHLEDARAAYADAGDAAGVHLATVHGWLAALARDEFVAMRAIAPLEWGPLHGPVLAMAEWAASRGSLSYCAGLGRLIQRSGQRWAEDGEFDRAELAYRLARGLVTLNGAVPPWTIPDALAQLDDRRSFQARSLVRRLQILDRLPPPSPPTENGLAWLQDIYLTTRSISIPTGVTGVGAIAIKLIESGAQRIQGLLALAGLAQPSDAVLTRDPHAALRAVAEADAADPAAFLAQLATGRASNTEKEFIRIGAQMAGDSLAMARPLASLIQARLAERQGWDTQAELWFRSAVEQSRRAAEGSRWIEVLALNAWGKREEAIAAFRGIKAAGALSESVLASLALRAGDYARAQTLFAALPMPAAAAPGRSWRDLSDRAEAALETGDAAAAAELAARGIDDFERAFAELGRDSDRLDASDDISAAALYQLAVRARLQLAEAAQAEGDAARAADLRDGALGIADRHRTLTLPVELSAEVAAASGPAIRQWQQASTEHATAYQRLLAALALGTGSAVALSEELGKAERAVATIEAAFTPEEEAAVRRGREARTLHVRDVQALLPPRACLLEYQLVGRDLAAFAITSTTMQAHVGRIGYRVEGVANRFLRACAGGTDAAAEAETLARVLLEPFAAVLEDAERVIVVPSSAINSVPFQLLPFGGEPLGATRVVSYLPAAALLARCGVDRPLAEGPTLVIGDPSFDAAAHPNLRRLAGAAVEARAVAKLYASDAVFTDADAREADLRRALSGRALVHVAAHGRLDEIAPNTSSIVLAGSDELTVSDLIGLHIDADLAVLSACDTGRGTTTLGGDLVGLARGLTAAGVQRCVVSLWPVDDVAACVTMVAFHRRVKAGVAPARALAEAQREIRSLSGAELAERYRALGGTLASGSRAVRRTAHGATRTLPAFPEVDAEEADTPVESQGGHLPSIWAPFVLIGA